MSKMDFKIACETLEINIENDINNITLEYLKKRYHKMALQNHPDKHGNTIESTKIFQQINEAYNYLLGEISDLEENSDINGTTDFNTDYLNILNLFLNTVMKGEYSKYGDFLSKMIKDIVNGYKKISITLFEGLDKERTLDIYNFLFKYKKILYIGDEILERIKEIILEKYKDVQIYLLNPSINDLFENNVYKLDINNVLYFVPLWHSELYFDDNIIVKCIPDFPENISIDDDNNIHFELQVPFTFSLLFDKSITFFIGEKEYNIPLEELQMKPIQQYILKKQGILRINENDIYNIEEKSDIIIKLIFCE